ncbi:MAG: NFACT RNA binding domain-containing protein [Armatimonadota bacterium]|nr:NFACT RNA binding domain-containing protein [Armatimonadota bacterium]MDR7563955.1 NFACT RNA binding domain-containing protein [Armatimonadota bacterium]MDR7566748.1 NFACT RNA binding domain-containing protein [Armatimonadota bacterium]MDR7601316.1 NFACT RNA binding domain-containing protein [Armatimonadota bacterium]
MPPPASFDSVVLAAVAQELRALLPLRVTRVLQPGPLEVVLSIRAPGVRGLLLSADARWYRIHLLRALPEREAPGPLGQLLRARLVDARILGVHQPPYERVLELEIEALDGPYRLVAELMGKHANLVVVREGLVLGCAKAIGPDQSRVRTVLPHAPYTPPPPDPRPHPGTITPEALAEALQTTQGPLWRRVLAAVAGIGPLLSYELASRSADPEATELLPDVPERLHAELAALHERVRSGAFEPRLYRLDAKPVAYAPFPLTCMAGPVEIPTSMSEAVDQVVSHRAALDQLEEERTRLLRVVRSAVARTQRALEEAEQALAEAEGADRMRMAGEILLAHASRIPAGMDRVTLPDYEGRPMEIALEPDLDAVRNAQRLFRRYAKLRAARQNLSQRIPALREQLEQLEELRVHLEHAQTPEDLLELQEELVEAGILRPPQKRPRGRPVSEPRTFQVDSFQVLVGRSSRDNDHLTFRVAGPEDLWLHARGISGAHVILRTGGRTPPEEVVRKAAQIAAYFSAGRSSTAVEVDVTERRWVSKPKGARPGRVLYRNERTLRVHPGLPEEEERESMGEWGRREP